MTFNGNGSGNSHYNPDEPRDERGRWTAGGAAARRQAGSRTGSWANRPLADASERGRAYDLLLHAHGKVTHRHVLVYPNDAMAERFGDLIKKWNNDSALDDKMFADRYLGVMSRRAVGSLRAAAALAQTARTQGDMAEAGTHLAQAIQTVDPYQWDSEVKRMELAAKHSGNNDDDDDDEDVTVKKTNFVAAFLREAQKGADQLGVPVEIILGLSALESG